MQFVFMLIIGLFCIFVLFAIIRAAINGSDLAIDIREIRRIMEQKSSEIEKSEEAEVIPEDGENCICPACGGALSKLDKECPECGLVIR